MHVNTNLPLARFERHDSVRSFAPYSAVTGLSRQRFDTLTAANRKPLPYLDETEELEQTKKTIIESTNEHD